MITLYKTRVPHHSSYFELCLFFLKSVIWRRVTVHKNNSNLTNHLERGFRLIGSRLVDKSDHRWRKTVIDVIEIQ